MDFPLVVVTATEISPHLTSRARPPSYANPAVIRVLKNTVIPVRDVGISEPYRDGDESLATRYRCHTRIAPGVSLKQEIVNK